MPALRTALIAALAFTSLPLATLAFFVSSLWSQTEQSLAEAQATAEARVALGSLEAMIGEAERALDVLVKDPEIDWTQPQAVLAKLATYQGLFPFSRGISMVDPQGRALSADPAQPGISVADRPWFQHTLTNRAFTVGEFVYSRTTGVPSLPLASVVEKEGRLLGVVGLSLDLAWFDRHLHGLGLRKTTITLVGRDGTVLVRFPDPQTLVGKPFSEDHLLEFIADQAEGSVTDQDQQGVAQFHTFRTVTVQDQRVGSLILSIPNAEVHGGSQAFLPWLWLAIAGIGLFTVILAAFGVRQVILKPVHDLSSHTAVLAGGNFETRMADQNLPSELKPLCASINLLAESLAKRDEQVTLYRINLEEMVTDRTAALKRSNDDLQQFAYVASHDLQEPLRMVASFTQLLERKYAASLDDQARQYIHYAVDGATRMQQLINDLLAYSRVETQTVELTLVDAQEAVQTALENLDSRIADRGAQVEVAPLPAVLGHRGQLIQVFQNLIGNGIKFNRSTPPRVVVGAVNRGSVVEFSVEDNGIGIAREFRDQVFVIFQRLNPRDQFGGTGIGLAVCKKIIERHGGTIRVEAGASGGSRFVFTLPNASKENRHGK